MGASVWVGGYQVDLHILLNVVLTFTASDYFPYVSETILCTQCNIVCCVFVSVSKRDLQPERTRSLEQGDSSNQNEVSALQLLRAPEDAQGDHDHAHGVLATQRECRRQYVSAALNVKHSFGFGWVSSPVFIVFI